MNKHVDPLDFLLTAKQGAMAAKRFFQKKLNAGNSRTPRVINVDKHKAYPPVIVVLQPGKALPPSGKGHSLL